MEVLKSAVYRFLLPALNPKMPKRYEDEVDSIAHFYEFF